MGHGLKLMILLRLSPVIPFNAFNYAMGCTSISIGRFLIGSAIGILPGAFAYVLSGTLVASALVNGMEMVDESTYPCVDTEDQGPGEGDTVKLIVSLCGGVGTVLAVGMIAVYS